MITVITTDFTSILFIKITFINVFVLHSAEFGGCFCFSKRGLFYEVLTVLELPMYSGLNDSPVSASHILGLKAYATMPGTLGRILTLKIVWGWLIAPANCSAARVGTPAGYTFSSSIVSMLLTH